MRDRRAIYLDILKQANLSARMAAHIGDCNAARLECDHVHNLVDLIRSEDEDKHSHYYCVERPSYVKQCKTGIFRASFVNLWDELLNANLEAQTLQTKRKRQSRFLLR